MEAPKIDEQSLRSNSTFVFQDFALSIQEHSNNVWYYPINFNNNTRSNIYTIIERYLASAVLSCYSFIQLYNCSEPERWWYYSIDSSGDVKAFGESASFGFLF